ncbi:MAG: hypothetical protein IPN27_00100 [Cellvibrionales bacterium]|nr:hypothetical protein [Cellvibrionales bacterium]
MKKSKIIIFTIVSAALITGCTKAPPKCSDEETVTLIQQIISDKIGGSAVASDKEMKDNIKINLPRATAFDENINKYSCDATLVIAGKLQIPMIYESQIDDNGQHIVSIGGFTTGHFILIQNAISEVVKKAKPEVVKEAENDINPQKESKIETSYKKEKKCLVESNGDEQFSGRCVVTRESESITLSSVDPSKPLIDGINDVTLFVDNDSAEVSGFLTEQGRSSRWGEAARSKSDTSCWDGSDFKICIWE